MFALCYAIYIYICFQCVLYVYHYTLYVSMNAYDVYMYVCWYMYTYLCLCYAYVGYVYVCWYMYVLYTSNIVISCLVECGDDIKRYAMIAWWLLV